MKQLKATGTRVASLLAATLLGVPVGAQERTALPAGWVTMPREREIEVARSAAPKHLRDEAGVYVLEDGRYHLALPSRNGFHCLVHRVSRIQAPECYDAEGSATTLKTVLREAALEIEGKTRAEVEDIVAGEYKSGALLAPRRAGIVYMLSTEFKQHDHDGKGAKTVFPPHLMFYAPNLTNRDIGALPEHHNSPSYPFVLSAGKPYAYVIVVPRDLEVLTGGGSPAAGAQ